MTILKKMKNEEELVRGSLNAEIIEPEKNEGDDSEGDNMTERSSEEEGIYPLRRGRRIRRPPRNTRDSAGKIVYIGENNICTEAVSI